MILIILAESLFIIFNKRKIIKEWIYAHFGLILLLFLVFKDTFYRFLIVWEVIRTNFDLSVSMIGRLIYGFYTLSLGETVLPWNYFVTIPAAFIFAGLFIYGVIKLNYKEKKISFITLYLILPLFFTTLSSSFAPRHITLVLPAYYLILSNGICEIKNFRLKALSILAITLFCGYSIFNYYTNRQFHNMMYTEPLREASQYISVNLESNDAVVMLGSQFKSASRTFTYYYNKPNRYYLFDMAKESGFEPSPLLQRLKELKNKHKRIWYIGLSTTPLPENRIEELSVIFNKWLVKNCQLIETKKLMKDRDAELKRRYIKKKFLDYRIVIHLYKVI